MSASFLEAAATRAADSAPTYLVLCCSRCGSVIAEASELLCEPVARKTDVCWSYELDLLEQSAYVYSATNPTADRFDVARVGGRSCERLHFEGEPTAEFSWFPPLRWINARCPGCPMQLGWCFVADDDEHSVTPPPSFAGIILTKLREARVSGRRLAVPDPEFVPWARRSARRAGLDMRLSTEEAEDARQGRSRRLYIMDVLIDAGADPHALLDMWSPGWREDPQTQERSPDELVLEMRARWERQDAIEAALREAMAGVDTSDADAVVAAISTLPADQREEVRTWMLRDQERREEAREREVAGGDDEGEGSDDDDDDDDDDVEAAGMEVEGGDDGEERRQSGST